MALAYKIVLGIHIAAGTVALLVFWLPLVTRKGGRTHRLAGWVYVAAAATIAVTAVAGSHLRFWLTPPSHGRQWFLAHMTGMGTSCITTLTAFVVVNAPRLGARTFDLRLWAVPIAVLGLGLTLWRRYYAGRFTRDRVPTAPGALGTSLPSGR